MDEIFGLNVSRPECKLLRKGLDTVESLSVEASGFTKTRAFPTKSGQNISSSLGVTKIRAFAWKCG